MPSSRRGFVHTAAAWISLLAGTAIAAPNPNVTDFSATGRSMPLYFMVGASSYIGAKVLTGYVLAALSILVLYACGARSE